MTKLAKRITLLLMGILLISSTVLGVLAAKKISEMPFGSQVTIAELDNNSEQIGMMNFLLIGIDADGTRSDTNMLLSYDGYSDRINILSFPRDTKVLMNGHSQKLNAAMGVGLAKAKAEMDDAPEEELIRQVKKLSGLPVHYFVTVDFDGFKEIIDVLGGVEFNVPYNMNYDDPVQDLHIHLKKGQQHLDGQMAHDFVRFRQNNGGTAPGEYVMGDEGRIYWQQRFLKALIAQKARPEYFSKITDLFDVIIEHVRTNYTMQDLLKHIDIIQNLNVNDIESYQLPGDAVYENGVAWYVQDEAKTDQLIHDVFMPRSREQWEKEQAEKAEAEQAALEAEQAAAATESAE